VAPSEGDDLAGVFGGGFAGSGVIELMNASGGVVGSGSIVNE
jgi:hypothetical protein